MSFFDKIKKVFAHKEDETQYSNENIINEEIADNPEDVENLNDEETKYSNENIINDEIADNPEDVDNLKNDDETDKSKAENELTSEGLNENEDGSQDLEEVTENEVMIDNTVFIRSNDDFKNIENLINGGAKKIVFESDIDVSSQIILNVDNLIIEGNGHVLDAHSKSRFFLITGKYIIIHALTFQHGFHGDSGRASYSSALGRSELDSVSQGGAIYNNGKPIFIDCNFEYNKVGDEKISKYPPSPFVYYKTEGAAIYSSRGICYLYSCNFKNNEEIGKSTVHDITGIYEMLDSMSNKDIEKIFPTHIFQVFQNLINNEKIQEESNSSFKSLDETIRQSVEKGKNEIILNQDYFADDFSEIKLDIDNIIINGNGHTIDAQGKTRIFNVIGSNITLKNIVLKNAFGDYGGAIYNQGELNIIESTIFKNLATRDGGAIKNSGNMNIFNSKISDNVAEEYGGAISNRGELTITETELNNNTSQKNGGAISNEYESELTITETELNNNTSQKDSGGAIYNNGKLTITETELNNNSSQDGGGAIYNNGKLTITETELNNNTAQGEYYGGGALYNSGELTITETELNNNTVHKYGGAIYNSGELTITESAFTGNTSKYDGGAINNNKGDFKIFNCEFSNNKSPYNIILNNDSLQIHNGILKDNQSKFIVLNDGGESNLGIFYGEFSENNVEESLLCNSGKFCSVEKTVFQNNISSNTLNIINHSELTLINPKIKDKEKTILNEKYILLRETSPELKSKIYGDGKIEIVGQFPEEEKFDFGYLDKKIHENNPNKIVLEQDICLENYERDYYEGGIVLDIDNLVIDGNGKTINGADKSRIFLITGKNITLKNITFKNGHSHKNYNNSFNNNGGAIKINSNAIVSIISCKFINNLSESDGGAIENNGHLILKKSVITDNIGRYAICNKGMLNMLESKLNNNAGAILNKYESNIYDVSIKNNNDGISNYGKLDLTNSTVSEHDNLAISNSGELRISDSVLFNNKCGAIANSGELSIIKSRLNNNINRYHDGGAIYNKGKLAITESTLSYNKAKNGGAIWTDSMKNVDLIDCEFLQNRPNDLPDNKGYYKY